MRKEIAIIYIYDTPPKGSYTTYFQQSKKYVPQICYVCTETLGAINCGLGVYCLQSNLIPKKSNFYYVCKQGNSFVKFKLFLSLYMYVHSSGVTADARGMTIIHSYSSNE